MFTRKPPRPADPTPEVRGTSFSTQDNNRYGMTAPQRLAAIADHFPRPVAQGMAMDSGLPSFKSDGQTMGGAPDSQFRWYMGQGWIGYQTAAIMSQHWLIDRCCSMPARDAVRVGYDVTVDEDHPDADAILTAFSKWDKKYGIDSAMREYIHMGRVYGIRVAIFRVESTDPEYYSKPFNPDGVTPGSYRGISQVDPIWMVPELTSAALSDPGNRHFYSPEYYVIGSVRYHRSHLCVYIPHPVPDTIKPGYQYGGKSVPQMIYERVYSAERTANEGPQLAMTKRSVIMKTDAVEFWASLTASIQRLFDWSTNRDNYGVLVTDKESEDIVQLDTSLADLDAVIMTQYQLVAAISEVPATKLLMTSPKGFNATGEADQENYRIMLESVQTCDLDPLLEKHHLLVWLSDIKPKFPGADIEINSEWRPLDSPTTAEWADISLKKAQAAQALAGIGAVDGQDVREQLRRDKQSDFFGLVDDDLVDGPAEPQAPAQYGNPQA